MSAPIRWCTIADAYRAPQEARYQALDKALQAAGLETSFEFLIADQSNMGEILEKAKLEFSQIRFAGQSGSWVLPLLIRLPSSVMSLKSADALVYDQKEWWPRFYLVEGLNQMLAKDVSALDLSGSVFIFGATCEARAAIAALSKIGFNKMIISDPDEAACSAFVEEMKRSYFGTQFQSVARQFVTQLPGVCSIAVNTLSAAEAKEAATEIAYFNFLKAGGMWLDLSIFPLNSALQAEAVSVGATILSGAHGLALTDQLWAKSVFQVSIDLAAYTAQLSF